MRIYFLVSLFLFISTPAFAALDSADFSKIKELKILRITPQGYDVATGNQIVIQFNRPVVPIGAMERDVKDIPVKITPNLECQWRWLNNSALSCILDEKNRLKESTLYKIVVSPGIKAQDGQTIKSYVNHQFVTMRADVVYSWFKKWLSPSVPVIRLTFNQPVTKDSVAKSLFIIDANTSGKEYVFNADRDPDDREIPKVKNGIEARRIWLVTPKDELPLDKDVSLKIKAGLVSAFGEEIGIVNREIVRFRTFPAFKFLGIKCKNNDDKEIIFSLNQEQKSLCDPMSDVYLSFSSPVLRSQIKNKITFSPKINFVKKSDGESDDEESDMGNNSDYSHLNEAHQAGKAYDIRLPRAIKPDTLYQIKNKNYGKTALQKASNWLKAITSNNSDTSFIRDEFNRPLIGNINIAFKTDHRKPNFEIAHTDAVIESGVDSQIPLYVNNINNINFNYRKLTSEGAASKLVFEQTIPKAPDVQFAVPLNVRQMLGGKSGVVYGSLNSNPIVKKSNENRRLFAQVTPYQVHAKIGHFNSIIWVTDMATGLPVDGAKVVIYKDKLTELSASKPLLSQGITSASGVAILSGTEKLDSGLELYNKWKDEDDKLFVRVDKDGKMALLPISGAFLIDSYRSVGESVYSQNKERYGHIKAWGTTAQGVYRAGDTIQYKFYVRNQNNKTLTSPPKNGYDLEIIDPIGNKVFESKGIKLNAFGAYSGEFTVSTSGAVGWYQFVLSADFNGKKAKNPSPQARSTSDEDEEYEGEEENYDQFRWTPIRVLISDFTPSPFKVTNQTNGDLFHFGQKAEVATNASLHSGGLYNDANVRITALLAERIFTSKDPIAKDFTFGKTIRHYDEKEIFQKIDRLDNKGENKILVDLNETAIPYGKLLFESAVQDDRGKYVTSSSSADYVGVDRFVGLKMNDWFLEFGKTSNLYYLVTDERGKLVSGTKVNIKIERQETKVSRVKGAGNAYLNEFVKQWVNAGSCAGVSTNSQEICKFNPNTAGYYRITAQITDTKGRNFETEIFAYVTGKNYVAWDQSNDYSLEIIPQKTSYKVGDKAKFLIKNPYPGAKALVSIERYGVIDHFVKTLEGSSSVIEVPIKPDYIPGFYLSVVVFSPRVEKPIEGQVDLGKPSFKIGYLTVEVKDKYKQMLVSAKTDKNIYKPREKVSLSLHAEPKMKNKKEPIEFAVAVLDESVFDLITGGKSYFDPYQGFYKLDGLDLRNYSLLTRLVGRQKFEKKGANPGGDGGSDLAMRSLFKFVSYWNPSIAADVNGNAKVEFEVPDNLTGWRVLAIAVTPSDIMGLGDVNFKVNRPTEIRPVMPNQLTEGDDFSAGFSVMNRTDKKRDITVKISAKGNIDERKYPSIIEQKVSLEPYKRTTIWMSLKAKNVDFIRGLESSDIEFTASAGDDLDKDALAHKVSVKKSYLLETAANYGTTTQNEAFESVKIPYKTRTDVGNISLILSPSAISNVSEAFKYVKDYPYSCWEQKLTKGVMASYYLNLSPYLSTRINWKEAKTLPSETLKMAANFQAPNGGMAYFVAKDDYADPYLSTYTALAFNWLKSGGYQVPKDVEGKLHKYLDNFLKKDAYPDFYNDSMASTVRAVALAALAENNKVTIADLERYRTRLPQMSLFGKTYFAKAATYVKGGEKYSIEATNLILSHANQSAGKFTFSETLDGGYNRILSSPLRENCAILSLFVRMGENPKTKDLVSDIPLKLINMITGNRGDKSNWENTQEDMFCVSAIDDYAKIYESAKPELRTIVKINGNKLGEAEFTDFKNPAINLVRNLENGDSGKDFKININRSGQGRIYYAAQASFARTDMGKKSVNSGMEIVREYSVMREGKWQLLTSPIKIRPAEVVKVNIFLTLPAARNFVVVDDPVPGGLEPVNRNLATASIVDAKKAESSISGGSFWFKYSDWISYNISRWSFNHQELKHDAVRFYSDYLPAGRYLLSYTAQAIAPGEFKIMPVYVGEMYNPDVYGRGIVEQLNVQNQ